MSSTYTPGVRNLDLAESAERRRGGWIGLGLTIVAAAGLAAFRVAAPWRLLLFFPAAMAAIGFLQARSNFCVMVALSSRSLARNHAERRKDRNRAFVLIATALVIAALVAGLAYLAQLTRLGPGVA